VNALWDLTAIAQGFWQGVFQLLALAIVAAFGTFIYQRRQARYALREELIESINQFAINLYKPRKLYQAIIDRDISLSLAGQRVMLKCLILRGGCARGFLAARKMPMR
jgi:hypothetical protein